MSTRPSWDEYFLAIAATVATRADCTRRQVGAVIVKAHRIVSTGYNGAPSGQPGCLSGACPRGRLSYAELAHQGETYDNCVAIHAEANALLYASRDACEGAALYVTCEPCTACHKLIQGAGIVRVITPDGITQTS
jgi:dCMP deaminase